MTEANGSPAQPPIPSAQPPTPDTRPVRELFDLTGRVALVTGGSRGLGLEIAHGLGEAGAKVAITARRAEMLEAARAALEAAGVECLATTADVGAPEAARELVAAALDRWGRLDILVNNAGISWGAPAEAMPLDRWQSVLATNATGTFLLSQAAFEPMAARGGGSIVNVASVAGLVGSRPEHLRAAGYSASKGAIVALTRQLAVEWARQGIRVNAIAPSFFPSRLANPIIERHGGELARDVPLGRLGRPGEIKGVVVFLASDAASYVTGQTLAVDGGATAW